jgi:hypothetical protein
MCIGRSFSHISIPVSLVNYVMMFTVFLKTFGIMNWTLVIIFVSLLILFVVIVGHYDVKYNVYAAEVSINNENNPEIKAILGLARKKESINKD